MPKIELQELTTEVLVPAGRLDKYGKAVDPDPAPDLHAPHVESEPAVMRDLLSEVQELVSGDRNHDYGNPSDNHRRTADLWNAYLSMKYDTTLRISAEDVCWLNVLQKMARNVNRQKRDNFADAAGWAANAYVCGKAGL
jgi:hypothetical protein